MELADNLLRQWVLFLTMFRCRNFGTPFYKPPFLEKNKEKLLSPFIPVYFWR
jgi:hypothetical protein